MATKLKAVQTRKQLKGTSPSLHIAVENDPETGEAPTEVVDSIIAVDPNAAPVEHDSHPGKAVFAVRGERADYEHIGGVQIEDYTEEDED